MEMSGRELLETFVLVAVGMAIASAIANAVGIDAFWFQLVCAVAAGALLGLVLRLVRRRRHGEGRDTRPESQPPSA
jgi:membrane protein implicated in regulation of membrane protease activity